MNHNYFTRQKTNTSDKYFEYNSDENSEDTSVDDTTSYLSSFKSESEMEFDDISEEYSDIESNASNKSETIHGEIMQITPQKNNIFNLLIEDSDEDNQNEEYEKFLNMANPEEKKEILLIENEIAKINQKRVPLRYQILKSNLPIDIKAIAIQKLEAIQKMDDSTNEYHKISHWIDGLLKIPFNTYIEPKITLGVSSDNEIAEYLISVKKKLDESVYGHEETKSTLLEIVSSWISNPKATPTVIGLQGPPGTGKTTLIKNGVAKALNRPFSMIALGGATDASYLEGHNYTYEGSNWGKLVSILMETKCMNPIIFFDELDKVSETKHGEDIIGVLMHLIDYSQNDYIQDRYFSGIPLDFSKCLFIFSFNDETRINPILKDRILVIRTESSNKDNKLTIAKDYLIPNILLNVRFNKEDIIFNDDCIHYIIEKYTNDESGVRNLKRCLESIILKLNTLRLTHKNPLISSSPGTQLIPYYLNNYKLPMVITIEIVEKLLKGTSLNSKKNEKIHMMYI